MQPNLFSPVPGSPSLCCSSTSHQNIATITATNNNQRSKPSLSAPNLNNSTDCNPAKGGIYITKEDIHQMMKLCDSEFTTDIEEDQRCLFGYYKESKSMQIIGGQVGPHTVRTVIDRETQRQCQILVMNIDLKFKSTQKVMYLVAMENDDEWKDRMKWKIQCFLDCDEIQTRFGISRDLLPESSRNALRDYLNFPPIRRHLPRPAAMEMINKTRFEKLLSKSSKRRSCTKCPKKGNKKCSEFRLDERRNGGERMCVCGHSARDHGIGDGERVHCIL